MKNTLKKALLGSSEPIPEYTAVGLTEPQNVIRVCLEGLDEPMDVTHNCVVTSLRPFILAIGFDNRYTTTQIQQAKLSLVVQETSPGHRVLGRIQLTFDSLISLPDYQLCLFRTPSCANYCLSPLQIQFYYLYRWWERWRHPVAFNFLMTLPDLRCHYVFYTCPRPVVLVTTIHGDKNNIFPMDLLGPVGSGHFLLALRTTSPSVPLMVESKRIVLSYIPIEYQPIAYELGKHHKKDRIDWSALPFETMPSPTFEFPIPVEAMEVRELVVEQTQEVGSHMLFVTKVANRQVFREGLRLFHIQGLYHLYRQAQGLR